MSGAVGMVLFFDGGFSGSQGGMRTEAGIIEAMNSNQKCRVHGTTMRLTKIPLSYGLPAPDPELWDARGKLFPNSKRYLLGGCIVGSSGYETKDWVCHECRKAERAWMRKNGRRD